MIGYLDTNILGLLGSASCQGIAVYRIIYKWNSTAILSVTDYLKELELIFLKYLKGSAVERQYLEGIRTFDFHVVFLETLRIEV